MRVNVEIINPIHRDRSSVLCDILVDAESMLSWLPAEGLESAGIERKKMWQFRRAGGELIERWCGAAIVRVQTRTTIDDVIFAAKGDPARLGARSLSGLNLRIDPVRQRLVDAGPIPAATAR